MHACVHVHHCPSLTALRGLRDLALQEAVLGQVAVAEVELYLQVQCVCVCVCVCVCSPQGSTGIQGIIWGSETTSHQIPVAEVYLQVPTKSLTGHF